MPASYPGPATHGPQRYPWGMIKVDYANCTTERVGEHGIDPTSLSPGSDAHDLAVDITRDLARTRGTGWERWRDLCCGTARDAALARVEPLAAECRDRFDTLLVLGIGGSALGNLALHAALNPSTYNLMPDADRPGPRVFVLDNVDPALVGPTLDLIRTLPGGLGRTLVNVISKSGETAETAAQFLVLQRMLIEELGESAHAEHIVAITDPERGTMRSVCDRYGYRTLPVPEGVGGRFSVLSPVGLFSAAVCGIDTAALLDGAAHMDQRCTHEDLEENPAAMLATLLVRLGSERHKTGHVLMPYSNSMGLFADWYRQLWAESLGKHENTDGAAVGAGFTPIKALGATDQHSQIQLYREGPNDKVIGFVDIAQPARDLTIPAGSGIEPLAYLEGATLGTLLAAEKRATEYALVESQRPNYTITLPTLDAHRVGEFIQLWMVATAYAGRMLRIDAYNQPAVETGKKATFGLMGRAGYSDFKRQVDDTLAPTRFVV